MVYNIADSVEILKLRNPYSSMKDALGPDRNQRSSSQLLLQVGCHCCKERPQLVLSSPPTARTSKAMTPKRLKLRRHYACSDLHLLLNASVSTF